jgi:hypothetical protein
MSTINVDVVSPQSVTDVTVSSGLNVTGDVMSPGGGLPSIGGIKIGGATNSVVQISNYNTLGALGIGTIAIGNTGQPTGMDNVLVGRLPGQFLTSGAGNTCVGSLAGNNLSTGGGNVCVGNQAGAGATTGGNNTFVGSYSNGGLSTTGSNNTCLGNGSSVPTVSSDNTINLGNSGITVIRAAVTSITSLSDARDKKDVKELPVGLDFIKGLKPVKFVWDDRNEDGRHDIKDFGFIAQDLKKSQEDAELADTLKLVYESNPEKLEASYGKLVPILVKAIQDLSAKVEALETKKK